MKNIREIQQAHDAMVRAYEQGGLDAEGIKTLTNSHSVLGWVLGHGCGSAFAHFMETLSGKRLETMPTLSDTKQ